MNYVNRRNRCLLRTSYKSAPAGSRPICEWATSALAVVVLGSVLIPASSAGTQGGLDAQG
jgi:hypothetical protein